jgi:hypothetical protein
MACLSRESGFRILRQGETDRLSLRRLVRSHPDNPDNPLLRITVVRLIDKPDYQPWKFAMAFTAPAFHPLDTNSPLKRSMERWD